jgi:hypothetical protein
VFVFVFVALLFQQPQWLKRVAARAVCMRA